MQIALRMWRGDEAPYDGTHYQLLRPLNSPNTLQRPHPPILIAGSGERKTLRLVARYGDMCNLFDLPGTGFADNLKHKLDVLRGALRRRRPRLRRHREDRVHPHRPGRGPQPRPRRTWPTWPAWESTTPSSAPESPGTNGTSTR